MNFPMFFKDELHQLYITTAKGMEALLLSETQTLLQQSPEQAQSAKIQGAGVMLLGSLESAYRLCLGSRIANRVLLPLKSFDAPTPEKLYGGVKSIRWTDHLCAQNTLAVDFNSNRSKITHTKFGALKTKDAIVDQLRSVQGARPSVDPVQPDIRVNVYVHQDHATVYLDLSGDSLHRRGYREKDTGAPLKENLAAAILMLTGWNSERWKENPDFALYDPMCGSGTLPLEAALIAADIAPGLGRNYFGFLGWKKHNAPLWSQLVQEATDKARPKLVPSHSPTKARRRFPKIIGTDSDFRAIRSALNNLESSSVIQIAQARNLVHFEKKELNLIAPPTPRGILVMNPPYGERLGDEKELVTLYQQLGNIMKQKFKGWEAYLFTGNKELAKSIGLKASRRHILYNGAIECRLLRFDLY